MQPRTGIRWAAAALIACFSTTALAASFFTEFLIGGCLLPEAKFDGVVALAKISGWQVAPEEYWPLMKPSQEPLKFAAWFVDHDGGPYIVAASVGMADGVEIPACSIMGKADLAEIEQALSQLGAKLMQESDEVVQHSKVFSVSRLGNRMLVTLVYAPDDPSGLVSAGVADGVD